MAAKQIGIMHSGTSGKHGPQITALTMGIKSLGLSDSGGNADFKIAATKYADDQPLDQIAKDLDETLQVDVIVAAGGTASALAAQKQTGPTGSNSGRKVVFTSITTWPPPTGVVAANMTGIIARTTELDLDRLEKLSELLPHNAKVGILLNAKRPDHDAQKTALTNKATGAGGLGLQAPDFQDIDPTGATPAQIEKQIGDQFKNWKGNVDGVLVAADSLFNNHRPNNTGIISDAANNNLPTIYQWSHFVDEGGLISYGTNLSVAYFLAGRYVGHIVKGATVASLPPLTLDNLEMVINLQTAGAIPNFSVPDELIASADRIITAGVNIPIVAPSGKGASRHKPSRHKSPTHKAGARKAARGKAPRRKAAARHK